MSNESPTTQLAGEMGGAARLLKCPNCGSERLDSFYKQESVPSHSCLLMPSREHAVSFPKGDIELACCSDCGFIANVIYDVELQAYSAEYEETQHFSGCFNAFARSLAAL